MLRPAAPFTMAGDKWMELVMVRMLMIVSLFQEFMGSLTNIVFLNFEILEGAPQQACGQLCLDEDHLHT
jgi:hypothetical protein